MTNLKSDISIKTSFPINTSSHQTKVLFTGLRFEFITLVWIVFTEDSSDRVRYFEIQICSVHVRR